MFKAIDSVIAKNGLKINCLLRISPLIPFALFNYMMGVTGVKITHFLIGGFGMVPGVVVYVYFGTCLKNLADAMSGSFSGDWV